MKPNSKQDQPILDTPISNLCGWTLKRYEKREWNLKLRSRDFARTMLSCPHQRTMKKSLSALIVSFVVVFSVNAFAARCTGSPNCRACSSCRYCAHCAKQGGTCGVCSPSSAASRSASVAPVASSASQTESRVSWWVYVIGVWAGVGTIAWGWQQYQRLSGKQKKP